MPICPNCGEDNPEGFNFCPNCAAPVAAPTSAREQRKTVTILICDLVHSTTLAESDPEVFRRIQRQYFNCMQSIIDGHGGIVEKFVGDEVMAVFGVPVAHEDDALRAVRAAREMQDGLEGLNRELAGFDIELKARIGVNTGEVVTGDSRHGHAFVSGDPVVVAKRLEQAARAGEILIGKATYPLVQHAIKAGPLETFRVKGKREEVGRRRVEDVDREASAIARRLNAPIVGRDHELELLLQAFERTVEERSCRLFTILGAPGIGKSRLAAELASSVGERATSAIGRCLPYGEGITFWPLRDLFRDLGGEEAVSAELADDDQRDLVVSLLRGAVGNDGSGSPDEVFWAIRRALEALARRRPIVLCLDDLHWAEPTLLDAVEFVVGWSQDAPILVLALARPEFVEQHPEWIAPKPNADAIALEPLSRADTEILLATLSEETTIEVDARARIGAAAGGNPLFIEHMTAMAAEQKGHGFAIPPSIQALLAERLDRLTPEERKVVERAAVIGHDFSLTAVEALSNVEPAFPARHLLALSRKGFVRPDTSPRREHRFSFTHVLIRETAYESMPKGLRADLHEQFADWLESVGRRSDLEELIGYHLEQAQRYRVELGLLGDETDDLASRAAGLLASAGVRARGRNDLYAARSLLERAIALDSAGAASLRRRLDLAEALFLSGQLETALGLAGETEKKAAAASDEVAGLRARLWAARIRAHMPPDHASQGDVIDSLLAVAEEARSVFLRSGDELALTEAWLATAWGKLSTGRFSEMLEAVEELRGHARQAGTTRWDGEVAAWQGTAMFYGATPVDEVLRWYDEQQTRHPIALTQQGMLEAMRGNFVRAREIARAAEAAAEEFGQKLWFAAGGMALCEIELLAGDPAAAEAAVRPSCELLEELDEQGYRWTAVGQLAAALYALDRLDEADECARSAEQESLARDVASQILGRQVQAKVLARRGDHGEAGRVGRDALALVQGTDIVNWRGAVHADLAEVYELAERLAEARSQLEKAVSCYDLKGNRVAAARARERLWDLSARAC